MLATVPARAQQPDDARDLVVWLTGQAHPSPNWVPGPSIQLGSDTQRRWWHPELAGQLSI